MNFIWTRLTEWLTELLVSSIMGNLTGLFDGINDKLEFKDFAGMPQIADAVEKAFGAAAADKICHGNALRLFKEVIG